MILRIHGKLLKYIAMFDYICVLYKYIVHHGLQCNVCNCEEIASNEKWEINEWLLSKNEDNKKTIQERKAILKISSFKNM